MERLRNWIFSNKVNFKFSLINVLFLHGNILFIQRNFLFLVINFSFYPSKFPVSLRFSISSEKLPLISPEFANSWQSFEVNFFVVQEPAKREGLALAAEVEGAADLEGVPLLRPRQGLHTVVIITFISSQWTCNICLRKKNISNRRYERNNHLK